MRKVIWKSIRILLIFLLSACNFPRPDKPAPDLNDNPVTKSPTKTIVPQDDYEPVECAFMWANESLPELSADLDQTLKAFQTGAEGYAQAYGENCVTNEGEIVRFHAMETDYYITLKVEDLDDQQTLGELIEGVMEVMADFSTDETPGPQPGYIGITFESDTDSLRLWVKRTKIEVAMNDGLREKNLLDALQSQ